jgi:hypothetical protein
MKELIQTIAKALVDHPDEVRVHEIEEDRVITYHLLVNPADLGKVIGKQGRIAKAIRIVASSAAVRQNKRIAVEISS